MKKFVTMIMVLVMALVMTAGFAGAEETTTDLMPKIHIYDQNIEWGDDYDLHMLMFMTLPDYGDVYVEITSKFDDNEWNYNAGKAAIYDVNTGELIDEYNGRLADEIDCSSMEIETVRANIMEYVQNYDFEADYQNGIRVYSIWF